VKDATTVARAAIARARAAKIVAKVASAASAGAKVPIFVMIRARSAASVSLAVRRAARGPVLDRHGPPAIQRPAGQMRQRHALQPGLPSGKATTAT
jgi:hypothetical protein